MLRKSKHFREWRGGGEPVYLEESLHVFEMLQNIWQGMISSSSCSCNTYLLLLVNLFLDQKYYINLKYSEIKLLGLDEEKTWIVADGRSCREKTKVIEAGL